MQQKIKDIEGRLSPRESKLLFLFASCPTTAGEILEIGSYRGKSTITLAKGAQLTGRAKIIAVDPLTSPSITDPKLVGAVTGFSDFQNNLKRVGAYDDVEFHQKLSSELAQNWNKNIRLLWIDGDHTYSGAKNDFDLFMPFLSKGGIIAFHDVLQRFEGPIRVFAEDVLLSKKFGAAGFCGSIGWAQYIGDEELSRKYEHQKMTLYKKLRKLIPYCQHENKLKGIAKLKYKLYRSLIPHYDVNPDKLLKEIVFFI